MALTLRALPNTELDFIIPSGGLDLVSPALRIAPGACRDALNFESDIDGGYSRIAGYSRWAGNPEIADQLFYEVTLEGTDAVSLTVWSHVKVQGVTSGATMHLLLHEDDFLQTEDWYRNQNPELAVLEDYTSLINGAGNKKFYAYDVRGVFQVDEKIIPLDADDDSALTWPSGGTDYYVRIAPTPVTGSTPEAQAQAQDIAALSFRTRVQTIGSASVIRTHEPIGIIPNPSYNDQVIAVTSSKRLPVYGSTQEVMFAYTAKSKVNNHQTGWAWAYAQFLEVGVSALFDTAPSYIETVEYNFIERGANVKKVYGVSGVGQAWEYVLPTAAAPNGTFTALPTGMATDHPEHVAAHQNRLFLSFGGSLQYSTAGDPTSWSVVLGAGERQVGENIIKLQSVIGGDQAVLLIYTTSRIYGLYGSDATDFNLVLLASDLVVEPDSIQMLDRPVFMTDRGITILSTTQRFGNFEAESVSHMVLPYIKNKRRKVISSVVLHHKNQYRIFFDNGDALYCTFKGGKLQGLMPMHYDRPPTTIARYVTSDGEDRVVFLSSPKSGFMYRMDTGPSFDGRTINSFLLMAFNPAKSSRVLKTYKKLAIDVQSEGGYVAFNSTIDIDYARMNALPNPVTTIENPGENPYSQWDDDDTLWDDFYWDGFNMTPAELHVTGTGENFALVVVSESYLVYPFTISGVTSHYIKRRLKR